jgi:hypothetical protein
MLRFHNLVCAANAERRRSRGRTQYLALANVYLLPGFRANARRAHERPRLLNQNDSEFAPQDESHEICVE